MNPETTDPLDKYNAQTTPPGQDSKQLTSLVGGVQNDWKDLVGKRFQMGWEDVASSRHNVDMMNSKLDDQTELTQIQQGVNKPGADVTQASYEAQPWHIRAVADAAGTLPGLGDSIAQGAIAGAGTAAVVGGATTVATGGNVAAGAAAGASAYGYGATAGSMHSIWEQTAGQMYGELRLKGVSRNTAKTLSYTFGSLNAGLELLHLKAVTGVAGKFMGAAQKQAIAKSLDSPFVKQIENNMLGRLGMKYAEAVGTETATEGAQQVSTELAKTMAGYIEKNRPDAFTNWDSATHSVADSMLKALGASAVLSAGSGLGGFAAGHATELMKGGTKKALQNANIEALNKLEGKSPKEILQMLQEGIKNQPNPWEDPGEEHSVAFDEKGNPIIKITSTKQGEAPSMARGGEELVLTPGDLMKPTFGRDGQTQLPGIVNDPQKLIDEGLAAIYPDSAPGAKVPFDSFQAGPEDPTQLRLPLVEWRPLNATETQSRLNQIATDKRTLKKEVKNLEDKISHAEKVGSNSFTNIERWQKTQQTIDALDSERDVLESGLGTTDIQGPLKGQQRIRVLNKMFDKMTAQVTQLQELKAKAKADKTTAQEVGFKKGAFQEKRAIAKMQQDLKNIVRAVTTKSGERFTAEERNQIAVLDAKIAGVTTPAKMLTAIAAIKQDAAKLEQRRYQAENLQQRKKVFDKVVKLVEGNRVRLQSGHESSGLPPELTSRLQTLRGLLKDESALKVAEFDFEVKHGNTPIDQLTPEDMDALRILNMARALHTGDELSQNVTAGTIAQWVLDGKNEIKAQKEALAAQQQADVDAALQSMGAVEATTDYLTSTWKQRLKQFHTEAQAGDWTWNTLLDRLSPKDPNHTITEMLEDTQPRGRYLANREIAAQNLRGFLRDSLGPDSKINLLQYVAEAGREKISVKYNTPDGSSKTVVMTKAQMIDAVLKHEDPTLHEALREGNKFTLPGDVASGTSFIERVQTKLSAEDKALAAGVLAFYKDYHSSVNEKYKQVYNVDLPIRDNYSPVSRAGFKVEPPFSKDGLQFWSLLPGSAKTRQDSKLAINLSDPFQVAMEHINQWEYWKAYTDKMRTINNVLTNPGVRQHISQEYGSGTLYILDNFVERLMKNEAIPNEPNDSFWSAMQSDIAHHALGLRPVTGFLTQLSSGLNYWADYTPLQIAHGVMQSVLHPIESEKTLRESPILKHRYKEGAGVAMERAMHQGGLFGATISKVFGHEPEVMDVNKYEAINRFIFAGYMQGDAGTARLFGAPVYWAERGAGKTHEEALLTVERIAEQTQQSSSVSQTPYNMQNSTTNTLLRMFTQQPIQTIGKSGTYINDFFSQPQTPEAWMKLGWRLGMTWFVPGALLGAIRAMPAWLLPPSGGDASDDEDRKRETIYDILGGALLGPLGGLPIIGDIVQGLWLTAAKPLIGVDETRRADYFAANPLSQAIFENPKEMLKRWSSLNKEEDVFKAISLNETDKTEEKQTKFTVSAMKTFSTLIGAPGQVGNLPMGLADKLKQGDTVGAALAIGGWGPGALKQRDVQNSDNPFQAVSLDAGDAKDSVYDRIQAMLSQIVKPDKAQQAKTTPDTSRAQMDALIKGIQGP